MNRRIASLLLFGAALLWPFALAFVRIAELRFFFGRLLSSRYRIWAAVTFGVGSLVGIGTVH